MPPPATWTGIAPIGEHVQRVGTNIATAEWSYDEESEVRTPLDQWPLWNYGRLRSTTSASLLLPQGLMGTLIFSWGHRVQTVVQTFPNSLMTE